MNLKSNVNFTILKIKVSNESTLWLVNILVHLINLSLNFLKRNYTEDPSNNFMLNDLTGLNSYSIF